MTPELAHQSSAAVPVDAATRSLGVPPAKGARGKREALWRRGLPLLSVLVFLGVWQTLGRSIDPILLATPTAVIRAFGDLLSNGQLWPAFLTAMGDLAVGYGAAIVVGIAVGILMGRSQTVERILNPYVNFFQATPLIALVPLVVIWFGVGFKARVVVTFLLALWSVIINTATGVKQTPDSLIDVGRIYKFNRRQTVLTIALPNAVPSIFAGLRIALGKALIGVIIAQMEISVTGLGGLVVNYGNAFKTAYLLAGIITASLVGVVAAVGLELLRKWLFPWTKVDRVNS
jgi:ABC-type nitrate/sulfonate/bicarbonate transport system permease component